MKKIAVFLSLLLGSFQLAIASPIYLTSVGEPWGTSANSDNFDAAFGVGNWDRYNFGDAGLFADVSNFIYVDGGDGNTSAFEAWMNANRASLEAFVSAGGSVFVNAARWSGLDGFDLGFGASLDYSGNFSSSCTLTNNLFAPAGTVFTGNGCSHDVVSGAGFDLLATSTAGDILIERDFGLGHIMLGGMTTTNFHSANGFDIRVNMLLHGANYTQIPEPAGIALLGLGLLGLGLKRRKAA